MKFAKMDYNLIAHYDEDDLGKTGRNFQKSKQVDGVKSGDCKSLDRDPKIFLLQRRQKKSRGIGRI